MKKFQKIIVVLPVIALVLFGLTVSAHTLKIDGDIGVILHTDPDDDPIAGQPTGLYFEITDRTKKFDPANCDCKFEVVQNGKEIFSEELFDPGQQVQSTPVVKYTFEAKGVYDIILQGTPKINGQFQPFKLDYNLRVNHTAPIVDSAGASQKPYNHTFHYVLIGIGVLIAFGMIGYDYYENADYYNKKWFGK
ncbi:MAG: hypothetical protein ACHQF4_02105 [Sphingobacteriales bacterium]